MPGTAERDTTTPPHVVLVDDDPDILDVLTLIFTEDGFRASSCQTHDAAVRILTTMPTTLLVTDLRLAGRDGMELIRLSQQLEPVAPKVILLTAMRSSALDAVLPALDEIGAEIVNKPFDIDQLLDLAHALTGWPGRPLA